MRTILFLFLSISISGWALPDFSQYEIILEKQIFGKPAPEPVAPPTPTPPPGPSWIHDYRMAMLVDEGNGNARAGLVNLRDNSIVSLSLNATDSTSGIQFLAVDFAQESAVFSKSGDRQTIKMSAAAVPVAAAAPSPSRMPPSRGSMGGRRFNNRPMPQPPSAPPQQPAQPRLTGEQLEAHLQEYQKEVLRKGMPPLPVALTPENDAELVREGVLPALEVDAQGNVVPQQAPGMTPRQPE